MNLKKAGANILIKRKKFSSIKTSKLIAEIRIQIFKR